MFIPVDKTEREDGINYRIKKNMKLNGRIYH